MSRYSPERKAALLKKLLPPHSLSVAELARQEGISEPTLYAWSKQAKAGGAAVPGDQKRTDDWSAEAKLAVVIETAPLSEIDQPVSRPAARLTSSFRPNHWPENTFVVIGAGTVDFRRGGDIFIVCAKRVLSLIPNTPCRFVWIGSGYYPTMICYILGISQIKLAGLI